MPDLVYEPEIEEGWGAPGEPISLGMRTGTSLNIFGSKLLNRIFSILLNRLRDTRNALKSRALWTDVTEFFWPEEGVSERPATRGTINNFFGFIFRKEISKDEIIYWNSRAKFGDGAVRLIISGFGNPAGGVMFSVGVGNSMGGPFTTYSPVTPLTLNPDMPQPQMLEIAFGDDTLTVGKIYYFRLTREYAHLGDDYAGPVVVTGVMAR